jgi:adenylate cyclase
LAVAVVVGSLLWVPAVRRYDWGVYDYMSTLWPPLPPGPAPVLVAVDEPSFADVNRPWPWPRGLHGRLIESLRAAGARVIGFDVVFAEPGDPIQDALLAQALGPDVVLASTEAPVESAQVDGMMRIEPLPMFLATGAGSGNAAVDLDDDAVLRRIPARDGAFAAVLLQRAGEPTAARAGALIQYFVPATAGLDIVSYYQALDPGNLLPPGLFEDRIVIVGLRLNLSAEVRRGGPDLFETSATVRTRQLASGAEVQAVILQNLRRGLAIGLLPNWAMFLLTAAAAAAGAGLNRRFQPRHAVLTLAVGAALIVLDGYVLLRFARWWTGVTFPLLALASAVGTQAAWAVLAERAARRRITSAFQHYLSPSMVEMLARDPGLLKLGGEQRELTILFCDVRGFTAIAEALKDRPERLVALMNRVLTRLSDVVLQTGGTIDKYIGDCVMAFWNAPLLDPDHARHGAEAAVKMLAAIAALNDELAREGADGAPLPRIDIGIGMNTGSCIVGNMGSERRFDYSAVGDAVNLASRLESLCKTYGRPIVISGATRDLIARWFETEELDRTAVRGRREPVTIHAITGAKA